MLQSPVMDTLAISGKLRAAGFTEPQAAAQVEALQEATKNDLQLAKKSAFAEMEARLKIWPYSRQSCFDDLQTKERSAAIAARLESQHKKRIRAGAGSWILLLRV